MQKLLMWCSIAISLLMAACSAPNKNKITIDKFPVTNPLLLDTIYIKEYVADIQAVRNVEIRARVSGEISKIHIDEGQFVRKGQLLYSIEDHAYREELAKAKALLKNAIAESKSAELDLENAKILVGKNVVSNTEISRAEAKLEALQAKIEEAKSYEASAQLKLSFTQIKAPFDGIIDRTPLKIGSLVEEGTLLTTLSDNSEVFAYFNVSENEYLNFIQNTQNPSEKNEVSLLLANSTVHPYLGKVETIEGEFDKATGNISFRARFPNPKKILKHGSSGKIRLKNEVKDAIIIPHKSTFEVQDKIYVFVVDSFNKVEMKSIVPKISLSRFYILNSGLSAKERILYEGIQKVKEGDSIQTEVIPMRTILKEEQ